MAKIFAKIAGKLRSIKEGLKNDENITRGRRGIVRGVKELPRATGRYLVQKVPVVHWLPNYAPRWLADDIIAGVTVALVLIPQALATAALAGIPLQDGLFASWLPSAIYFFMGTTKDIATGPTTSLGLLTGAVVLSITAQGSPIPPALVAAALSFSVGAISLVVGLLRLGWILNFVSVPMLVGFQMTSALIIVQAQVPFILGEANVSTVFTKQAGDILTQLNTVQPLSVVVGVASAVIIIALKLAGKYWGHKSNIIRVVSNTRNALVVILFTIVSYIINRKLIIPQFPISGPIPKGIASPQPPTQIILLVITKSLPIFIASASEHLIFAKSFARRNHYTIDQSQELVFLGTANIANGAFGGMPVSGSLSLSAVNSTTGVRSPLGGLFTTTVVLLAMTQLTEALKWIPNATIGAIILISVAEVLPPNSIPMVYWKGSFADFLGFFIVMNVGIVSTPEIGLGLGVLYMVSYTLLRTLFSSITPVDALDIEYKFNTDERLFLPLPGGMVPQGTRVISLDTPMIYLNAERIKTDIMETVWTYHEPTPYGPAMDREIWSDYRLRRTASLRRRSKVTTLARFLPRLEVLVLDFTHCSMIDNTGLTFLQDLKDEVMSYSGQSIEIRFVGFNAAVKKKFLRIKWPLGTMEESHIGLVAGIDILFEDLRDAVAAPRVVRASMNGLNFGFSRNNMEQSSDEEAFNKGMMDIIVTNAITKDGKNP